jgi:hypothetical protein
MYSSRLVQTEPAAIHFHAKRTTTNAMHVLASLHLGLLLQRERWDLTSLKALVEDLQQHAITSMAALADSRPCDDCSFHHHDKTTA